MVASLNCPGVVSLVTKTLSLVVAIVLAGFQIQKDRPFLLHCVDKNSTLLDKLDNVTICDDLVSCFAQPGNHNSAHLSDALRFLERADQSLEEQANRPASALEEIFQMRGKISQAKVIGEQAMREKDRNPDKLVQKVRICGENETTIRVVTLTTLVCLITLAAFATFQLHTFTNYMVSTTNLFSLLHISKDIVLGAI